MNNTISFKHSCFSGDLIYALAGIKALCSIEGDKANIYQWLNRGGLLYPGAAHPYKGMMMNEYAFDMMKPLIDAQPYIKSFEKWYGQPVNIDLDKFRQELKHYMPYGNIVTWPSMVYVEMTPRYWEPWLEVPEISYLKKKYRGKIVVNRTSRYHSDWLSYFFLKEYQSEVIFVGMDEEHEKFQADWGLLVEHEKVTTFLQLALIIKHCKVFVGNQSMCFAIAEALKVPRVLEVCDFAPNVIPAGDGGYSARVTEPFKYIIEKLLHS